MNEKTKVVLFGLGKIYRTFLNLYDSSKVDIVALSDNNSWEWDKNVVKPEEIRELNFDYVIITCSFFEDIKKQLLEYGINEEQILNYNDIYNKLVIQDNWKLVNLLKDNILLETKYKQEIEDFGEKNLFINAKNFAYNIKSRKLLSLEEAEFQVFSQFGEDGIIQWLIQNIELKEKLL